MTRLMVLHRGLREAEDEVGGVTRRLLHLTPTVPMIQRRWMQSEQRLFAAGRFRDRETSTKERYTRPGVRSGLGRERRTVASPGNQTLVLSGRLRHVLTTKDAPGQLADDRRTAGGMNIRLGALPKGRPGPRPRGPIGYAHMLARKGRDPVSIDRLAVTQATDDVTDYLLLGRTR